MSNMTDMSTQWPYICTRLHSHVYAVAMSILDYTYTYTMYDYAAALCLYYKSTMYSHV